MWLTKKFVSQGFTISTCVVLGVVMSTEAIAQTEQQKQQPAPAPKQQLSGAPTAAQPTWMVNCTNVPGGFDCRASQTLLFTKTGMRALTLAVQTKPSAKAPVMLMQLPLGVYLPAGVTLQIGKEAANASPFLTCDQSGCLAEHAVTNKEITAMEAGADLTVAVKDLNKAPINFRVPGLGFAEAFAKMK
jgi:invasion protein IalB